MARIALLVVSVVGLLFTAWLDDPENYSHDAIFPAPTTTTAASSTSTTSAAVVAPPVALQATATTTKAAPSTTHVHAVPSTTAVTVLDSARCPEWWPFAAIYFDADELPIVDRIIWNESRCLPDVVSKSDDLGLTQINWGIWGDTINSQGFYRDDLFNPAVNLQWAWLIANEAERLGWCRWQPWSASGDYGCDR